MFDGSGDVVGSAVRRVLAARGPMTEDDLLTVLDADGVDLGPDPQGTLAQVLDEDTQLVMPLPDDRWAWIPALLDGRVFTHRLSAAEIAHDLIGWGPDLAPVAMLTDVDTYRRLADGSPVSDAFSPHGEEVCAARGVPAAVVDDQGALLLPPGYLGGLGVGPGDVVGLRVTGQGFELTTVAEPAPCDVGAQLAARLEQHPDRPEMLDGAVWTVCADDGGLFREPTAPLGEVLAASGLACEGDWVARGGFDFAVWRINARIDSIQARYGLDDDEALAVLVLAAFHERTRDLVEAVQAAEDGGGEHAPEPAPWGGEQEPDGDHLTARAALESLAEPAAAAATLDEIGVDDAQSAMALGVFAESAEPLAPRAARPALRWLRAKAHEALGDYEEAETTLHAAESLDPSWPLTLLSLARYAGDRGDAERGLALLRRAGAPADDDMVQLLERFRPTPRTGLGRNERCWCGSGRKYKVCHLNREQLPLEERAAWLYQKALSHLLDGPFASLLVDTAEARAQHWDSSDALIVAMQDDLVCDAVLFEGGAFADFLGARGFLLPEDERSLAEQWLLLQRSVHEVLDISRGRGFTARDVRTGDVCEVRERTASTTVHVGEFYCARIVPAGDTVQIFGGLEPVSLGERDALIGLLDDEPDPVNLVAALSRRFAPPVLQNTEGEPLMIHEVEVRVGDPAALARALDDVYERDDNQPYETQAWYEHVTSHGMRRVRARLELSDDELYIHANSANRIERVLNTIRALDPSATVVSETREPIGDLRAIRRLAERGAPDEVPDSATDPAVAAALGEFIRAQEAAWLDEPIPALAGHTPRECADDPTRRPDLIRLLDSFPADTGRPGTMSTTRLRAALGLD